MFCPNCSKESLNDSQFCEQCGTDLREEVDKKTAIKITKRNLLIPLSVGIGVFLLLIVATTFNSRSGRTEGLVATPSTTPPEVGLEERFDQLQKEIAYLKKQASTSAVQTKTTEARNTSAPSTKATTPLSNPEIIKRAKPATVYIKTLDGSGSGMIIDSSGYVLTNNHVVEGYTWATVKLSDGRSFVANVSGTDSVVDLAILKIDATGLPTVSLGDSDTVVQGEDVYTLGFPFGIEGDPSFKEGTLSRKFNDGGLTYFEISAEIHPGNSGGPLINNKGQVIGINTFTFGKTIGGVSIGETIKFAVPINYAKDKLSTLKYGNAAYQPPSGGGGGGGGGGGSAVVPSNTDLDAQCKKSYGNNSYYTYSKNAQGGPICGCLTGYFWNSSKTMCVQDAAQWCRDNNPGLYAVAQTYSNGNFSCTCYSVADPATRAQATCKAQHTN